MTDLPSSTTFRIARDGEEIYVGNWEEMRAKVDQGAILPSDFYWQDGMTDWKPASELIQRVKDLKKELAEFDAGSKALMGCTGATGGCLLVLIIIIFLVFMVGANQITKWLESL